jgi:hypothetical protein
MADRPKDIIDALRYPDAWAGHVLDRPEPDLEAPANGETWRPLSELPNNRAMWVNICTPDGVVNLWRWLPYRKGSQPPYLGGRWQIATEYSFRNETLPENGKWRPNPTIKRNPRQ